MMNFRYDVTMTRLNSTHENLRTDVVEGVADELPELDRGWRMFSKSLDPRGYFRLVATSVVRSVETRGAGLMVFTTRNSTYELKYEEANHE